MSCKDDGLVLVPPEVLPPVDPFFELLAAFPVPKLLTTSIYSQTAAAAAACDKTETSDEKITKAVLESAHALVASGSYMALCRSGNISEMGRSNVEVNRELDKSGSVLSPLARSIHEGLLRMETEYESGGISGMKTFQRPCKHARWERNNEHCMTLRQRSALHNDSIHDKEQEKGIKKVVKVPKLETKPEPKLSLPALRVLHDAEIASSQCNTDSHCFLTVADIVNKGLQDVSSLESLFGMLLGASRPFKEVSVDRLREFVSSLTRPPQEKGVAETVITPTLLKRVVVCCAVISHSSFDLSNLAEDTVGHLITILAVVIRRIAKWKRGNEPDAASFGKDLECLRAMLKCFAVILCDTRLRVCTHGDLVRLEDLCFQCLFVATSHCGRQDIENYAAYVVNHAVYLYRCLWNRLEAERDAICERFFLRLPNSDNLLQRLYLLPSGVKTMVLTQAVVIVAQSIPFRADAIMRSLAERLQRQCCMWSSSFMQHFLCGERFEKTERDLNSALVLQFCEDLAHLIGLPEYPAADMLLRSFFVFFAQHCSVVFAYEGIRSLFADAVFRVSCVVFSPVQQSLLQSALPDSCVLSATQLRQWRDLTQSCAKTEEAEDVHSDTEMRRALLYMTFSRSVADPAPDVAANAFHTRAIHIFTWYLQDKVGFSESALEKLVRERHVMDFGVAVDWDTFHACSAQLCAAFDGSLLSPMSKERLPAWLLSVFQLRDEQHTTGVEAARAKVIRHVAKLTELHPPLLEKIWPIARCCVRNDNARVREAVIPLLLTILSETCKSGNFSEHVKETATDVISSLLHLLGDRSVAVVTRVIAALDTLLTEMPFGSYIGTTTAGENLLTFVESKLLKMMDPSKESRHQVCIVRLFLRRWVGWESTDSATNRTHSLVARELMRLIVTNMEYPYEVPESSHLVALMRWMCSGVPKRAGRRQEAGCQELHSVMVGVAKLLWAEQQQQRAPARVAAAALAAIHALAMAHSEWIEPLLEALAQAFEQPQSSLISSDTACKEFTGVTLLQVCQIFRTVLLAPRAPSLSLEPIVRALTVLLSRYVGPYQNQILFYASGVLTAAITSGCNKLSNHVNLRYLILCYSLMNTYYVRIIALVPLLCTNPQSIAYTLRFFFLISCFLRLYPGWKQHREVLTEEAAVVGSGVPNQLACGDGICANVYAAVEQVLRHCPEEAQSKMIIMALRVFSSLCILQPAVFFCRCEDFLHRVLDPKGVVSFQTQGLIFIRDFLKDEDARVDYATSTSTALPAYCSFSSGSALLLPEEQRQKKRDELKIEVVSYLDEQNSGMATWVMQQLHTEVLQLCESSCLVVRQLAFEVLQLCADGGLLPPSKYAAALMLLAADPQSEVLRRAAAECVASQGERYPDIIAASAAACVVKTFDLHNACGVNVLQSVVLADSFQMVTDCIHAHFFVTLRKPHRESLLFFLLRCFYHEGRAMQWLQEHSDADGRLLHGPHLFLGHLAIVLAYLPYPLESDVLYVIDSCRATVDMVGQSYLDFIEAQRIALEPKKRRLSCAKMRKDAGSKEDAAPGLGVSVEMWRCFGVLCLLKLRIFLSRAYGLRGLRPRRSASRRSAGATASHAATLVRPESQAASFSAFQENITFLVQSAAPLWEEPLAAVSSRRRAMEELHADLSRLLRDTEVETKTDDKGPPHRGSGGVKRRPRSGTGGASSVMSAREESGRRRLKRYKSRRRQHQQRRGREMSSEDEKCKEEEETEEQSEKTVSNSSRRSSLSSSFFADVICDSWQCSTDGDAVGSAVSQ